MGTLLMYFVFILTDSSPLHIVLIVLLFLTVVGIPIAIAALIYESCCKTEKCNKGLMYII